MDIPRCFIEHTEICEHFLAERNAENTLHTPEVGFSKRGFQGLRWGEKRSIPTYVSIFSPSVTQKSPFENAT